MRIDLSTTLRGEAALLLSPDKASKELAPDAPRIIPQLDAALMSGHEEETNYAGEFIVAVIGALEAIVDGTAVATDLELVAGALVFLAEYQTTGVRRPAPAWDWIGSSTRARLLTPDCEAA